MAYNQFRRRIHLICFYKSTKKPLFFTKCNWEPPIPANDNVNDFLTNIYKDLTDIQIQNVPEKNLSDEEIKSISELESMNNIIIKKADKGVPFVS